MTTDRTSSIDVESLHEQGVGWMGSVDLKLTVGPLTFRRHIAVWYHNRNWFKIRSSMMDTCAPIKVNPSFGAGNWDNPSGLQGHVTLFFSTEPYIFLDFIRYVPCFGLLLGQRKTECRWRYFENIEIFWLGLWYISGCFVLLRVEWTSFLSVNLCVLHLAFKDSMGLTNTGWSSCMVALLRFFLSCSHSQNRHCVSLLQLMGSIVPITSGAGKSSKFLVSVAPPSESSSRTRTWMREPWFPTISLVLPCLLWRWTRDGAVDTTRIASPIIGPWGINPQTQMSNEH